MNRLNPLTIGKFNIPFDTLVLGLLLLFGGMTSTWIITNRLAENARVTRESGNATRQVLLQMVQRMDDQQYMMKEIKDVQVKQRELFLKAEDLESRLTERANRQK